MSFFSNPTNPASTQGTSLFGENNNTPSNAGTSGLFSAQGSKPGGANIFGGGPAKTGTGNIFGGSTPAAATPQSTTTGGGGLFGGVSSSNPLFASGNTNVTSSATGTNPFFGGSTSGFSLQKPADQNSGVSKPTASSFFSQPAISTTGTGSTGLFGLPLKPADSTNTTNSSQSNNTPSALGGGPFGQPAPNTTTSSSTPAPISASSTFSLGGNKDSNTVPQTNKDSTTASGNFFNAKPTEKKDGAPPASIPSFNLFGGAKTDDKKDSPTVINASTTTSKDGETNKVTSATSGNLPNPVVAVPPPSMLRGKTLEEIVNRWTSELETHVREFAKFAGEVAVWDRALVENGNNLAALYSHVLSAERQQNEIEQSLDHIEQQQKDLASTLDAYEKVSQEILGGQGGSLRTLDTGPADTERDKNYMLATDLHTHLDDLSGSLTQMIDSVNSLSSNQKLSGEGGEDPMSQIAAILSSHLESLQWIDSAVREVDSKVSEVDKRVKESGHSLGKGTKAREFVFNR